MTTDTRIGIGIVHCQSAPGSTDIGYTPVFKSDNGKWSSIIDDTGTVFRHIKIDYDTILRMIHFSKDGQGWYMCSMKPIPGRDEEYRASWVYFPASLNITQKDIKTIIEVAESQIKEKEFDSKKLQELILSYNKLNEESPLYNVPSSQSGFAFRDTSGDYNLYDLYGCMYQKEFTQYEWVILMDKSLISFKGNSVDDISDREIRESHVIKPTSNEFGFIPYHDGVEFRSPIRILEGEQITIEFKKSGYLPITKNVRTQYDFSIDARECKKIFKKCQFVAYDSNTKKRISSAIIQPTNARESEDHLNWIFAGHELKNAEFKVEADGYTADRFVLDLRNMSLYDEKTIPLEPEAHEYRFVLPLDKSIVKDIDSAETIIHSQFVIRESPFKGYRCAGIPREGGIPNRLKVALQKNPPQPAGGGYNFGSSKHEEVTYDRPVKKPKKPSWIKYAFIVIFSLGLLSGGYYALCDLLSEEQEEPQPEPAQKTEWEKAFEYLDENKTYWSKSEMESYSELKGVYAMIKDYQFKELKSFIEKHLSELTSIDSWGRLYEIASKYNNKRGTFKAEDDKIDIEKYLSTDFDSKEDVSESKSSDAGNSSTAPEGNTAKNSAISHTPSNSANESKPSGSSKTKKSDSNNNTNPQDQNN